MILIFDLQNDLPGHVVRKSRIKNPNVNIPCLPQARAGE